MLAPLRLLARSFVALVVVLAVQSGIARAESATVAVSSNFLNTAKDLAALFEGSTGHTITIAHGSTGRLYAQIVSGAPFDLFLSADADRPRRLAADGLSVETRAYAVGRLVLVSGEPLDDWPTEIRGRRVALANPELAPFGQAAKRALDRAGIHPGEIDLLTADSVGQAASFFATGNAEFAFVGAAQLPDLEPVFLTEIDTTVAPIVQEAALLERGAGNPAARAFFSYLFSPQARAAIVASGYGLPRE